MAVKGYEAGKPTSFTPGRHSEWVEEFNQLLEFHGHYSRNKLTEKLIEEGMAVWKNQSSAGGQQIQGSIPPQSIPTNGVTLECDGLSSEQIQLLNTPEFQKIVNSFVRRLFEQINNVEDEVLAQVATAKSESKPEIHQKPVPEPEKTVVFAESPKSEASNVEIEEPLMPLPQKHTAAKRRASVTDALSFVKSTSLNN
jgi:hypothetical protein